MTCGGCHHRFTVPRGGAACGDRRTNAMVCHFCLYAEHDPVHAWVVGAVRCTISGEPINPSELLPACPLGKHMTCAKPVVSGVLAWIGLPVWQRWLLRAFHPKHPRPDSFPGCGCIKVLKDLWLWVKQEFSDGTDNAPRRVQP